MKRLVRPPEESPYSAMTVNERLFVAGVLEEFDRAAFAKNDDKIRDVLAQVDIGDEDADKIIEWVKNSPYSMYRNQRKWHWYFWGRFFHKRQLPVQ